MLVFVSQAVSVTTNHLCLWSIKADRQYISCQRMTIFQCNFIYKNRGLALSELHLLQTPPLDLKVILSQFLSWWSKMIKKSVFGKNIIIAHISQCSWLACISLVPFCNSHIWHNVQNIWGSKLFKKWWTFFFYSVWMRALFLFLLGKSLWSRANLRHLD